MELNLLPIINCEGKRMPIDVSLEIENFSQDRFHVLRPIVVKGDIINIGGCLELTACGTTEIEFICDRCAEPFKSDFTFTIDERMRKEDATAEENDNPDIMIFAGNSINLSEIVYDSLVLSLPTKILCSDNCKGICPVCGKNLNREQCDCVGGSTDPRFDILDKLL